MSRTTLILFIAGIALLIYGYLCRFLNIYFFWDSKYYGWLILASGLMWLMINLKETLKARKKNIFLPRVVIGILILGFAYYGSTIILLKSSYIYRDAVKMIINDGVVKNDIGDINGFSLIPSVPNTLTLANDLKSGSGEFIITVRGKKAYRDIKINLQRSTPMNWIVLSVNQVFY